MPIYNSPTFTFDIGREAVLLDTNVLVAAFHPKDQHHEIAEFFIREYHGDFIVPASVIVESWGMLVGRTKDYVGGINLFDWLVTPGHVALFPQDVSSFPEVLDMVRSIHLDCVDVLLARLAHDISASCDFRPHIAIATFDTSDITRCRDRYRLKLEVLDLRSFHSY